MNAFVSVLVPAYNARNTIGRALRSVVAQDYRPIEIIVVNDASTDDTGAVVQSLGIPEVRLINLPDNLGACGAMNAGLEVARGEYVAFLDADDEWMPGKLEKQIPLLDQNPNMVFATCGCLFVGPKGSPVREFGVHPPTAPHDTWRALLVRSYVAKPCVVARLSAIKQVGGFNVALRVAEDQDMWIRLAAMGEVGFVEELLVHAHDTPGSLTKVHAHRTADFVIPMVEDNIALLRDRLSRDEIRHIRGERYTFVGRNLYAAGNTATGLRYLAKGIAKGNRVGENAWYAITASPPARFIKSQVIKQKPERTQRAELKLQRRRQDSLLRPSRIQIASIPGGPPILSVVIDTEAEFEWSQDFRRNMTSVTNIKYQERAQSIFVRFGVKPTYAVAYAVAVQRNGYEPLLEFVKSDACRIGAHLQPWENPPFEESLGRSNSYVGNLALSLQQAKLAQLTRSIEDNFGVKPLVYKAGRYAVSEDTATLLESFGYEIDVSVLPICNLTKEDGPDFSSVFNRPYWFGSNSNLFEIPMTVGLVGACSGAGEKLYGAIRREPFNRIHMPGIFARLGLLERITLTPEGITLEEMKRLTRSMLQQGSRVFTLTYHSPSLVPGNTPYVRNDNDLRQFIDRLEGYLAFFFGELGGVAMELTEIRDLAQPHYMKLAAERRVAESSVSLAEFNLPN